MTVPAWNHLQVWIKTTNIVGSNALMTVEERFNHIVHDGTCLEYIVHVFAMPYSGRVCKNMPCTEKDHVQTICLLLKGVLCVFKQLSLPILTLNPMSGNCFEENVVWRVDPIENQVKLFKCAFSDGILRLKCWQSPSASLKKERRAVPKIKTTDCGSGF